jgi:hypothetical protein
VKGILEGLKKIINRNNIKNICKTKTHFEEFTDENRPEMNIYQTVNCVWSISCGCSRSYVGETEKTLGAQIQELKHNLGQRGSL